MVEAGFWDEWIEVDEEDIRLIDWGQAFPQHMVPAKLAQPFGLTAPEPSSLAILTTELIYGEQVTPYDEST
jgi:hypothetical protein